MTPMTQEISKPNIITGSRCAHIFANGRRCRLSATTTNPDLCPGHARSAIQAKDDFAPLPSLIRKPEDFQSAEELNASLGALHNLLAEGRISPRRAAVIAYVDSLILRTLPAIEHEGQLNPRTLIYDLPRPWNPEPASAETSAGTDTVAVKIERTDR